jgi:LPXTG-motif cell wall-anchored protein
VPAPRRTAALAAATALALSPAAALAQNGAGDQQYSDPFSGPSAPSKPKSTAPAQSTAPSPAQQAAPVQTTPAPSTPASPVPAAPGASAQLPRTGTDVLPLAILGAALIGLGLVLLRRRSAHDRR